MGDYTIDGVKTFPFTKIIGIENIEFGHDIIIDDFVFIYAKKKIKIGNYVHIACFVSILGGEEFSMDDFSWISSGARIFTGSDDLKGWGFGNPTISEEYRNVRRAPIRLGSFTCIGANSVILPGVTIGEGATVGACSVVTKDLEPWGVYIGNKRVAERDRDAVMKTYRKFIEEKPNEI
jgi:acetyltransferase-like isoleucine patch superfamily enzyme